MDTQTDLCYIYLDCYDKFAGTYAGVVVRRDGNDTKDYIEDHTLGKRARAPGGLLALQYPESSKLYDSPRSGPPQVFRFQNDKLGSTQVKQFSQIKGGYINNPTEHIIEVSILMKLALQSIC